MHHTPGLWKHRRRPTQFIWIVDDFGVKYEGKKHIDHLLKTLRKYYTKITKVWKWSLYAGITLNWNCSEIWVDVSMPGYIKNETNIWPQNTSKPVFSPFKATPKIYGAEAQDVEVKE